MSMIILKKTKDMFREKGLKTSAEAMKALSTEFETLCKKVIDNVESRNLKIVKAVHVPKLSVILDSQPED